MSKMFASRQQNGVAIGHVGKEVTEKNLGITRQCNLVINLFMYIWESVCSVDQVCVWWYTGFIAA